MNDTVHPIRQPEAGATRSLLLIGPEPPPATGMELATRALAAELGRAGVPLKRIDTADPADELGNRSRLTSHNIWLALRHVGAAARWSASRSVGVVYVPIAQNFPALFRDLAFVAMARLARKRVVLHLHGGAFAAYYRSLPRPLRLILRGILGGADLGLVLSDALRPELACILPAERIAVVPNGIDLPLPIPRRSGSHEIEVLFLSVLYRWKGVLVFIEAFALAHARSPSLRATVAGQWPSEKERLEAVGLAERLRVVHRLTFPGFVEGDQKQAVFSNADIFCFASLVPEGHPLVIIEAMASALPVVAPAWPGVSATVLDEETGLLVHAPTAELLAERLVRLAEHPDERDRLGQAGRRRYEQLYTQAVFGERVVATLRPVLALGGVPVPLQAAT